jgi:glycosyltransferase involved in cell wall biosynthesis
MTIAIIGSRGYPFTYSGYETLVKELAEGLVSRGHLPVIYCHRGLFPSKPSFVNGVDLVYIPGINSKFLSQLTHSLLSVLHASLLRRPDVLLVVNSANGPLGLLTRCARIPTVINVDGIEWLRPKWKGLGSKYFHVASFLATKFFDVIVTDAEEMSRIYLEEFAARSRVIEYGADITTNCGFGELAQFGLTPRGYFLVVGRLIPDNNLRFIVREYENFSGDHKLVVLGDVPYKDEYAESVKGTTDRRIIFPGYISDQHQLTELYANCLGYIHGHEFGGTNPSLIKALGSGCCIIALDTVFAREVLLDGEYGFFFSKENGALTSILEQLRRSPALCESYREKVHRRIEDRYTWERIVGLYVDKFEQLVSRVA